jgi:putative membrane protein
MNKLITSTIFAVLSVAFLGCGSASQNTPNSTIVKSSPASSVLANADSAANTDNLNRTAIVQSNFWERAAQGGMAEAAMSNLALSKSQNTDVKNFAQMMLADHTKANNELKALAAKKKVTLPTQMGTHQSKLEDLNRFAGADFDREYVEAMIDDHKDDVELFKNEAENSKDTGLKDFAAKTLPTLQTHLRAIREIQSKMQ